MLLSKEIAVSLNLAACKFKQYTAMMLRNNGIDLTPEQFLLIDLLWNQGAMSQQNLADSMEKDKNSITKLVDALENKGLVVRVRDKSDRRSNTVILTQKAEDMKNDTKEFGIAMLDGMLAGISEEELRGMLSTLAKLSKNMDTHD
ncbi:MAG: MarR family transcriptional regulator [Bacteroidaceae bacterium]|nr:MarR family transcriptional regulator [Bacteroidaceae bacterium]